MLRIETRQESGHLHVHSMPACASMLLHVVMKTSACKQRLFDEWSHLPDTSVFFWTYNTEPAVSGCSRRSFHHHSRG